MWVSVVWGNPGAGTVRFHAAKVKMDALHWDH